MCYVAPVLVLPPRHAAWPITPSSPLKFGAGQKLNCALDFLRAPRARALVLFLAWPCLVEGLPNKRCPSQMSSLRIFIEVLAEDISGLLSVELGGKADIAAERIFQESHRLDVWCPGRLCRPIEISNIIVALIHPSGD